MRLFEPFRIRNLEISNRVVMAPMTRSRAPGGLPTSLARDYYARRASGGVGLIITEASVIGHPASANDMAVPRLYGDDALAAWRSVLQAVHQAGGKMFAQLWHVGAMRRSSVSPNPDVAAISPSGLRTPGKPVGTAMTQLDIEAVIQAYGDAANNAKEAGFDGVEIHGAHGYLIDQFLWPDTNKRQDQYGEGLRGRVRFAVEVVRECRRRCGDEFPISFRFSQWKAQDYSARLADNPGDLAAMLLPLVDAGVDVFHCSTRRFWQAEFEESDLTLAGWTKKLTGLPVITVGGVGLKPDFFENDGTRLDGFTQLNRLLDLQQFDLVAVGRALLADPCWANKVKQGQYQEMTPFVESCLAEYV